MEIRRILDLLDDFLMEFWWEEGSSCGVFHHDPLVKCTKVVHKDNFDRLYDKLTLILNALSS